MRKSHNTLNYIYFKGEIFYYGRLGYVDYEQARVWYEKAAEQGEGSAMFSLGYMYANELLGESDYSTAAEWYRKAAEAGNKEAMNNLGM